MAKLIRTVCVDCGETVRNDDKIKGYRHAAIGVKESHPVKKVKAIVLIESY